MATIFNRDGDRRPYSLAWNGDRMGFTTIGTKMSYKELGTQIGELVESKQKQYGDSAGKSGAIMNILYPDGIKPYQMDDALLTVRILDKLSRIAQRGEDGKDLGGESPFFDISGYGLLGAMKDGHCG